MNILDFFCNTYSLLRNYRGVPFWVMTPFRKVHRKIANAVLPVYLRKNTTLSARKADNVIVSLTSFPARIDNTWQVVECMLRQTMKPNKIILWLSKEQFFSKDSIPQSLQSRENEIFEIRIVEGDVRSHKKYYYAAKEYSDCKLFLIDDDIYYPTDIIEKSLDVLKQNPNHIISNYGLKIEYDQSGKHLNYNSWKTTFKRVPIEDYFFGSGGGTLIEPRLLYKDLTNIDMATRLCPLADDVWLNAMARLAKVKTIFVPNGHYLPIISDEESKLYKVNNGQCQNDVQIANVEAEYTRCFDKNYLM